MNTWRLKQRTQGQTIVLLALLLGILMIVVALVIDVGSHHRVRTETQYVCDAGALAGMATVMSTHDPGQARTRALDIVRQNGYTVGQNGVTSITVGSFNHLLWPFEGPGSGKVPNAAAIDVANSDRYMCQISRELPQYIANIIGVGRTGTTQWAVAAIMGAVPIDVSFGSSLGFPDKANISVFGPDAPYSFGDAYDTKKLDDGTPNPLYNPDGWAFDMVVPSDLRASSGSSFVRVEIFDPDCINQGTHVSLQPSAISSTNGQPDPNVGGLDEIRCPPPNGNGSVSATDFPTRSTQTNYLILDKNGQTIAQATYGPASNTKFWYQTQAPASDPINTASSPSGDPARAQISTDLHWVTPQGFEFDSTLYPGPYSMRVRPISGSSENGYSLRVSAQRPHGAAYDPIRYGTTATSALAIYARGKMEINLLDPQVTKIPIGSVPATAQAVTVTNFDTDVGAMSNTVTMQSFDSTTGQGKYPVLWQAPANASGSNVVSDTNGNKYYTSQPGHLSGNGNFSTDTYTVPQTVVVPKTDGNGNLVFNGRGQFQVVDTRPFQGADVQVSYSAGAYDTSDWEVSFSGPPAQGHQQIVLIR